MWRKFAEGILKVYIILGEVIIFFGTIAIASEAEEIIIFVLGMPIGSLLLLCSATILGLFVEGVKHLERIENELIRMGWNFESIHKQPGGSSESIYKQPGGNSKSIDEQPVVESSISNGWRCSECGEINKLGASFCKSCGKSKY